MSKEDDYKTIRIPQELNKKVDWLIGRMGFRSKAEIVKEALRDLLVKYSRMSLLEHFDVDEHGVKVLDRRLNKIVDVLFKPEGIRCAHCKKDDCDHVEYVLTIPSVQDVIRSKVK